LDSRTSFHIGVLVEVPITDKLSVQPEVLYSSQGSKFSGVFTSGGDNLKLDYVNVPILGKYHIIAGLSAELGPVIGILVNADDGLADVVEEDKERFKSVDIGVGVGASYRLPMGLFGSLRYQKGVSNINEDILNSSVQYKNQNNIFQVSAGYTF